MHGEDTFPFLNFFFKSYGEFAIRAFKVHEDYPTEPLDIFLFESLKTTVLERNIPYVHIWVSLQMSLWNGLLLSFGQRGFDFIELLTYFPGGIDEQDLELLLEDFDWRPVWECFSHVFERRRDVIIKTPREYADLIRN